MRGVARAVFAGFEELVEHVVFVGRHHQTVNRQSHLAGYVAGTNIAEVTAGHAEAHFLFVAGGGAEIAVEIINDLRQHAPPVDRVDGTDAVFFFETGVVLQRFDDVLAVIEHAFNRDIVDIFVLQAVHLRALEGAHFAFGRHHKHVHTGFAAQGVFRRRTGVAAGGAENVQRFAFFGQHIFKGVAEKLHGDVFKRQRRAVRQGLNADTVLQGTHGSDVVATEHFGVVAAVDNVAQIVQRNIGGKQAHDGKSQIRIAEFAPFVQNGRADFRVRFRQHQAAVGRQAHQEHFAEWFAGGLTAGTDVFHNKTVFDYLLQK